MRVSRVLTTALLAAAFAALPVAEVGGIVAVAPAEAAATPAQEMLTLVNAERSKVGCGPVRLDARLNRAASKHSTDMATNNYFSHTSRDGRNFVTRIRNEGYPTPRSENIAAGRTTAQATFTQWMNSSGHRRNILDCTAKDMGVGVASNPRSTYRTYWTQDFGRG
jgi:uncharacterized protein YkwD